MLACGDTLPHASSELVRAGLTASRLSDASRPADRGGECVLFEKMEMPRRSVASSHAPHPGTVVGFLYDGAQSHDGDAPRLRTLPSFAYDYESPELRRESAVNGRKSR